MNINLFSEQKLLLLLCCFFFKGLNKKQKIQFYLKGNKTEKSETQLHWSVDLGAFIFYFCYHIFIMLSQL